MGTSLPSSLLVLDLSHTNCSFDVFLAMDLRASTPQLQDLNLNANSSILELSFDDEHIHSRHELAPKVSASFPASLTVLKLE
eukprot:CAMPEP_0115343266 /NCGR_PEP_ID=MMETSP0270-20121206/92648_1 /TAXON_ID=71861 /ORGANISM="Scrippsiella trochoidea, Strain CCMP3099" /LENGTH=81 /DNA_ID=CAMNT_0002764895 /DNA_START=1 /DNA_END=243 /DNA_ORIENTATION=-